MKYWNLFRDKLSALIKKLPNLKPKKANYLLLSFLFPLVGMLMMMLIAGYIPFGSGKSMLYSDMWHQYYPFFVSFRKALLSGDSLLFNWSIGMGLDYLGLIAYYLASPLNLLSILVPESLLLQYFALLMPIKLGFAGLFFGLFLKKVFRRDDMSVPVFGAFYALCAWALGFQWNVMWLDTFALLPLVALGTVQLLKEKKFLLFTLSLFLSVAANYYIGFFTCIFVFFFFICYQICRCTSILRLVSDFLRIALFSILAIGMTLFLTLPGLMALQSTQSSVNSFLELPFLSDETTVQTQPTEGSTAATEATKSGLSSVLETFGMNVVDYETSQPARDAWNAYREAKEKDEANFDLWWSAVKASWDPVMEGMKRVAGNMAGGITPTFKEGLPNIYCGVGTIMLAFLFLLAPQIKLRDKLCCVFMLVFLILSFLLRQLDYIWHGFHFTNMIPYRFSFLYSFIMLYMAYRAWLLRRRFKLWQVLTSGVLALLILQCSDVTEFVKPAFDALPNVWNALGNVIRVSFNGDDAAVAAANANLDALMQTHGAAYTYVLFNALFFLSYLAVMIAAVVNPKPNTESQAALRFSARNRSRKRRVASSAMLALMCLELVLNIANFGATFTYTSMVTGTGEPSYPKGHRYSASMIRYMLEDDSDFYRAEATHAQTLNDGSLNGYNGISTFTSSANVRVTEFMQHMGYAAKNTYNRYCFEESSPVANLFLNLKYMIERDGNVEQNNYFDTVHHFGNVYLLENNAYLPLGFLAQPELKDLEFRTYGNNFIFQNNLFTAATGIPESVWSTIPNANLSILAGKTNVTSQSSGGFASYDNSGKTTLTYRFKAHKKGFMCLDLNMSASNTYSVYLNDAKAPMYTESISSLPQTMGVCEVSVGDIVEVRVTCKAGSGRVTIRGAILDEDIFRRGYEVLSASTLDLTEFSNTRVEGTVSCNRDGLLYTSIPQDGNWIATVDGQPANIHLVGDAMIALELTEGTHTVRFVYRNKAFTLGLAVSLGCLFLFALICFAVYFPKYRQKKLLALEARQAQLPSEAPSEPESPDSE